MTGHVTLSFLISLGFCAWIYPKVYNHSGASNTRQTLTTLGVIGISTFVVILLFISLVF